MAHWHHVLDTSSLPKFLKTLFQDFALPGQFLNFYSPGFVGLANDHLAADGIRKVVPGLFEPVVPAADVPSADITTCVGKVSTPAQKDFVKLLKGLLHFKRRAP
jgi:hypothetical protein